MHEGTVTEHAAVSDICTYQESRPDRKHYREHRGPGHIHITVVLDIEMIEEGILASNQWEGIPTSIGYVTPQRKATQGGIPPSNQREGVPSSIEYETPRSSGENMRKAQ